MSEKFDVIIVGAGPSGISAALTLAKAGFNVVVFERGEYPGSKNMFGGTFYYTDVLDKIVPGFWDEAPIERYITRYGIVATSSDSWIDFLYTDKQFSKLPYNAVTLLRSKFDKWFSDKAREAGVLIIPDTNIDGLIFDNNRVTGVKAARDNGGVEADVVIIADGANSLLVQKAGLGNMPLAKDYAVASKEILSLSPRIIEQRFNLDVNEGASYIFAGDCIKGLEGGAFLYTNQSTLSIGVVARLTSLKEKKISIADALELFKEYAYIKPLIQGAELKEYSGHLIPEGGFKTSPKLFGNGVLVVGDAARFVCSTGLTLQGMNFAIASGFAAGEAIKKAKNISNYSKKGLSHYQSILSNGFVLQTLQNFQNAPDFLSNPRIYTVYPSLACGFLRKIHTSGDHPRKKFFKLFMEERKDKISLWSLTKDIFSAGRGLF